jgi:2,4'-dihydroxyacetophenone dioxygenase
MEREALFPAIEKYGKADVHLAIAEVPWVEYSAAGSWFKPVRFNVDDGHWILIQKIEGVGEIGRHQHHGPVTAYTIAGSWRYAEYDWVAVAGDVVHESPGVIHTLMCDDPDGMEVLFDVQGPLDFFGDNDTYAGQQTVFWFVDAYVKHCEANGLRVDERLFY